MRIATPIALLLCAGLASAASSAWANETPTYTPLTAEQATELLSGEIIVELERSDPPRAETLALVQAPMRELGEIIADFDHATEWAPSLSEQFVVEQEGDVYIVQATTAIPWPIADRHFRTRATWEFTTVDGHDAFINAFELIPGSGNVDETFGYWLLVPYPEDPTYTYIKYVVNADPGIAVPDFLVRWVTRNALPDVIRALAERHADTH